MQSPGPHLYQPKQNLSGWGEESAHIKSPQLIIIPTKVWESLKYSNRKDSSNVKVPSGFVCWGWVQTPEWGNPPCRSIYSLWVPHMFQELWWGIWVPYPVDLFLISCSTELANRWCALNVEFLSTSMGCKGDRSILFFIECCQNEHSFIVLQITWYP